VSCVLAVCTTAYILHKFSGIFTQVSLCKCNGQISNDMFMPITHRFIRRMAQKWCRHFFTTNLLEFAWVHSS